MVAAIRLLVLVILTVFVIVACSRTNNVTSNSDRFSRSTASSAECRTIEHTMGKTQICHQPQKIVALGPQILEILLSLDLQPVGYADYFQFNRSVYDHPAQQIPYLGSRVTSQPANVGLVFSPNIEALLKVKPDLIIGSEFNANQYEILSKIAPTVLLKWFDTKSSVRAIAQAIGNPQQAEQVLAKTTRQLATARQKFSPIVAAYPQVLILNSNSQMTWNQPMNSRNSFCGVVVEDLGFKLMSSPSLDKSQLNTVTPISIELLPQFNKADLIIVLGTNNQVNPQANMNNFENNQINTLKQRWQKNAIAQSLQASKEGRVYFFSTYLCLGLPGSIGSELIINELQKQLLPLL